MGTLKAYANLIYTIVAILILSTVYIKGRFDGKAASEVKDYRQQVAAYEGALERSQKAYEAAAKLQTMDIAAALKASEERQQARFEAMQRRDEINAALDKQPHLDSCVLDKATLDLLNKSLAGGKHG